MFLGLCLWINAPQKPDAPRTRFFLLMTHLGHERPRRRVILSERLKESQTHQAFDAVRVRFSASNLEQTGGLRLVPGMPAEDHIAIAERTAWSYLLKPFRDQLAKAFKEQ